MYLNSCSLLSCRIFVQWKNTFSLATSSKYRDSTFYEEKYKLVFFSVGELLLVGLLWSLISIYSLSSRSFQSKVDTEVCVMGGKGGCAMRHTLGGGAGVLMVVRDMDDMVDIEERPPGEVRPPIREEGELHRPPSTCVRRGSSSSMTSSSMATLQ